MPHETPHFSPENPPRIFLENTVDEENPPRLVHPQIDIPKAEAFVNGLKGKRKGKVEILLASTPSQNIQEFLLDDQDVNWPRVLRSFLSRGNIELAITYMYTSEVILYVDRIVLFEIIFQAIQNKKYDANPDVLLMRKIFHDDEMSEADSFLQKVLQHESAHISKHPLEESLQEFLSSKKGRIRLGVLMGMIIVSEFITVSSHNGMHMDSMSSLLVDSGYLFSLGSVAHYTIQLMRGKPLDYRESHHEKIAHQASALSANFVELSESDVEWMKNQVGEVEKVLDSFSDL